MKAASLVLVVTAATAQADSRVRPYMPADGVMLVRIDDDSGQLRKLVGTKRSGVVQCITKADNVTVVEGAADYIAEACFVGVKHDGTLVAPPNKKRWSLRHLNGVDSDLLFVSAKSNALEVSISGHASDAIGLWIDCSAKHAVPACQQVNGMLGQSGWDIVFEVTKGGAVRAPTL